MLPVKIKHIFLTFLLIIFVFEGVSVANIDIVCSPINSKWVIIRNRPSQENVILIDVRSSHQYGEIKISNSLNIPLYVIKTKTFLKNENILLISNGVNLAEMQVECKKLERLGFKRVKILYGGILAWVGTDGSVEGNSQTLQKLREVNYLDIYKERFMEDWVMVVVSKKPPPKKIFNLLPCWQIVHLSNGNNFAKSLKRFFENNIKNSAKSHRLLFVCPSNLRSEVSKIALSYNFFTFYFLFGTVEGYIDYLQLQKRIQEAKKRLDNRHLENQCSRFPKRCSCGR